MCMSVYMSHVCNTSRGQKRVMGLPGAEATGGCDPLGMGTGILTLAANTLDCWAISPILDILSN